MFIRAVTPTLVAAGAALALIAGAYGLGRWQGYSGGYSASQAMHEAARQKLQEQLFRLGDELSVKTMELTAMRASRAGASRSIEDEVRADPGAADRVPSPTSLQRLQRRWSSR